MLPCVRMQLALLVATVFVATHPTASLGSLVLSGDIELIAPPVSVDVHDLESDDLARIFVERLSFTLASDLEVDFTATGTYNGTGDLPAVEPVIAAGTKLDSYFITSDNVGSSGLRRYDGSVTFDTEILGVILTNILAAGDPTALLSKSDLILGHPGTMYPPATNNARDLELGAGMNSDQLTLSADRRTLTFHFATELSADQLRILTAPSTVGAVPEPASLTLCSIGALGCGIARYRRRKSAR